MLIFCFTASNLKLPFIINLRFVWLHCTLLNWVHYIEGYNIVPVSWDETEEKQHIILEVFSKNYIQFLIKLVLISQLNYFIEGKSKVKIIYTSLIMQCALLLDSDKNRPSFRFFFFHFFLHLGFLLDWNQWNRVNKSA